MNFLNNKFKFLFLFSFIYSLNSVNAEINDHAFSMNIENDTIPACRNSDSDPDGDGWGWDSLLSLTCYVGGEYHYTSHPICKSSISDFDSDGWGWENGSSCRVVDLASESNLEEDQETTEPNGNNQSVSDYACTATPSGNNVVLSLSGVRAGSENLLINDVWRASLTGEARYTVTNLDTSATIEIRLRGKGYDGPSGFAVATCERAPAQTPAPAQTSATAGLELVWSDDFDGTAIDPTKWEVFTGDYGTPHRVQSYTKAPENVRVENGALILEATLKDGQWYSGMVNTNDVRGPDAARWATGNLGWTFGRFEIRARVPHATGMWPALWMRPINYTYGGGWPLNGEIDILEYIGPDRNPASPGAPINELIANAHWEQDGKRKQRKGTFDLGGPQAAAAFVSKWHTYAVEWTPHRLEYFVDGQSYHVIENWVSDTGGIGPFNQNFDIIMNLQVGGWPGDPVPSSAGSQMEIDWVRVYQDHGGK